MFGLRSTPTALFIDFSFRRQLRLRSGGHCHHLQGSSDTVFKDFLMRISIKSMDNMTFQSLTFQGDFQSRAGQHDTSNRSSKFDFWIEGHFNQRLDNMTVATGLQSLTVASKYQPAPHTSLEYRYASKDHLVYLVFPHCCHAGKLWQGSILIYLGSTGIGFGPVGSLELKPVIWNGDVWALTAFSLISQFGGQWG